jgi:hypothetical protein
MTQFCRHSDCFVPEVSCAMGELDPWRCPNWIGSQAADADALREVERLGTATPWHGNALGTTDLPFVSARGRTSTVGLVGAESAGKTTFLAAIYSLLARGHELGQRKFAGSYTLGGWEAVAHNLRWSGITPPSFPPHTPRSAERAPGLLHLAVREPDDRSRDLLVTDAPGEWFRRWAIDRDADDAAGARWVAQHATGFLLVVDSEALAGPQRGDARTTTQLLAQRLGTEAGDRPVGVLWAKADIPVPAQMRARLASTFAECLPSASTHYISVRGQVMTSAGSNPNPPEEHLLEPFDEVVNRDVSRRYSRLELPLIASRDPFLSLGSLM